MFVFLLYSVQDHPDINVLSVFSVSEDIDAANMAALRQVLLCGVSGWRTRPEHLNQRCLLDVMINVYFTHEHVE